MTRSTPATPRSRRRARAVAERRLVLLTRVTGIVVALLAIALVVSIAVDPRPGVAPSGGDLPLPNPMGGPAEHAPAATGDAVGFGGLEVVAPDVAMGEVPLDVTVVPTWEVHNPTAQPLRFAVGQPQVHEGCCPGPVVVDEQTLRPGDTVTVAPGDRALVQLPLQMHPGMDGPHHLSVPLEAAGDQTDLHVTGDFTSAA